MLRCFLRKSKGVGLDAGEVNVRTLSGAFPTIKQLFAVSRRIFLFLFQQALQTIGFKDGQRQDIRSVLAGILQLGNVTFANAGGAQVVEMDGKRTPCRCVWRVGIRTTFSFPLRLLIPLLGQSGLSVLLWRQSRDGEFFAWQKSSVGN